MELDWGDNVRYDWCKLCVGHTMVLEWGDNVYYNWCMLCIDILYRPYHGIRLVR